MKTNSVTEKTFGREQIIRIVIAAIAIALTYVFTAFVNITLPIAINGGLIHLGNVPLFLFAILFGKKVGALAGGIGMGLFDLLSPWAILIIKIVGYYFAEVIIYGNWVAPFTSIPGNIIQVFVAAVIVMIVIEPLKKAKNSLMPQ